MTKNFYIKALCLILLITSFYTSHAQEKPIEPLPIIEQQLENLTENTNDVETEDDSYLQEMEHFLKTRSI